MSAPERSAVFASVIAAVDVPNMRFIGSSILEAAARGRCSAPPRLKAACLRLGMPSSQAHARQANKCVVSQTRMFGFDSGWNETRISTGDTRLFNAQP